jgi:hypothetical protein
LDVAYRTDYSGEQVVAISASEDRVLLTRDVGALKHSIVVPGCGDSMRRDGSWTELEN